jgi:hypothetical protein
MKEMIGHLIIHSSLRGMMSISETNDNKGIVELENVSQYTAWIADEGDDWPFYQSFEFTRNVADLRDQY